MAKFKVVHEIEVGAESPLEAAQTALEFILDAEGLAHQFYVQEISENENEVMPIFSVDLDEDNAVLDVPAQTYQPLIS